jgi:uncharacterized protein (DUF2249 family)/DUF438 domain-containing protein
MIQDLRLAKTLANIILKAGHTNEDGLKSLRKELISILDRNGAKRFVTVAARILKNDFHIEGCNDARIPLKRIFAIPLEELEQALLDKEYRLPVEHPISILSRDHKDNIGKLKRLNCTLSEIDARPAKIADALKEIKDYYAELDSHIRKEEEVLFPVLDKHGMKEHPDNLKTEHKGFREVLSGTIESLQIPVSGKMGIVAEKFRAKFVPGISNHIFRETYIFYPAALEFIKDTGEWDKIEKEFNLPKGEVSHIGKQEGRIMEGSTRTLDLRPMPPFERHEKIFQTWDELKPGDVLRIINDHDPKPLRYQFEVEYKGKYDWQYKGQGPKDWIVEIKRHG